MAQSPAVPDGKVAIAVAVSASLAVSACGRLGFDDQLVEDAPPVDVCPTYAAIEGHSRRVLLVEVPAQPWRGAFDACEASGGRLFVPVDAAELSAIHASLGDRIWLGFSDIDVEGTFVAPAAEPSEVPYFDWLTNEPNDGGPAIADEDCVVSYDDGYNDEGCGTPRRYVCECDVIGS